MKRWLEVGIRAGKGYGQHKDGLLAAGITYYTLVSLFPLILFGVSVAGFFLTSAADRDALVSTILEQVPLEGAGEGDLRSIIDTLVESRGTLGVIGLVGAAWTGSSLFTAVRNGLNVVFGVEKPRNFFVGKAMDVGFVLLFGALLTVSFAVTLAIAFAQRSATELVGETASTPVRVGLSLAYVLVPTAVSFGIFVLLYAYVARSPIPLRTVAPGAVLASLGFEVLKVGFAWYVAAFGNYNATYGTLGFIVALLFFIYLGSQIMLFGAEFVVANDAVKRRVPATLAYGSEVEELEGKVRRALGKVPWVRLAGREGTTGELPAGVAQAEWQVAEAGGRDVAGEEGVVGAAAEERLPALVEAASAAQAMAVVPMAVGGVERGPAGVGRYALGAGIVAVWVAAMAALGFVLRRSR